MGQGSLRGVVVVWNQGNGPQYAPVPPPPNQPPHWSPAPAPSPSRPPLSQSSERLSGGGWPQGAAPSRVDAIIRNARRAALLLHILAGLVATLTVALPITILIRAAQVSNQLSTDLGIEEPVGADALGGLGVVAWLTFIAYLVVGFSFAAALSGLGWVVTLSAVTADNSHRH